MPYSTLHNNNKSPNVIWEDPRRYPSQKKMDSPAACANYAMPTANTQRLHPNGMDGQTTTAYTALA